MPTFHDTPSSAHPYPFPSYSINVLSIPCGLLICCEVGRDGKSFVLVCISVSAIIVLIIVVLIWCSTVGLLSDALLFLVVQDFVPALFCFRSHVGFESIGFAQEFFCLFTVVQHFVKGGEAMRQTYVLIPIQKID